MLGLEIKIPRKLLRVKYKKVLKHKELENLDSVPI